MKIAIISNGSIVVGHKKQTFLFGAPYNIHTALKDSGIPNPTYVFTTNLRAPGFKHLPEGFISYKEEGVEINGMRVETIPTKHGTDYSITDGKSKVLYSERGDVSVSDVAGFDFAVVKNKHRPDGFGNNIITWPWNNSEYSLSDGAVIPLFVEERLKTWDSLEDVPDNLKKIDDITLTLDQANFIARVAEKSADKGENFALAISAFKKAYEKKDNAWVRKDTDTTKKMSMHGEYEEEKPKKLTQEQVNYELSPKDPGVKVCANCSYWNAPNGCYRVVGDIQPTATR